MSKSLRKVRKIDVLRLLRFSFWFLYFKCLQENLRKYAKGKRPQKGIYGRLLALAAHALAEVFGYHFLS